MTDVIGKCSYCNRMYTPNPFEEKDVNICSSCEVDDAMHAYLRALRKKEEKLTFFEWLFLSIEG